MCQRYISASQSTIAGDRAGERAEARSSAGQPARGGPHDHAREPEQDQQRRDVAEQHVLDHVRREQVVLAEAVERRDERDQQREHPGREGERLERAGAAARRASLRACAKRQT